MAARVTGAFLAWARMRCPSLDELLLALAGEFRRVDEDRVRERLDDFSRYLFGVDRLDAADQAGCVVQVLRHDLGLEPGEVDNPDHLMLDRVLERRRGHPLLLAVIAVEIGRRAGVPADVCSSADRWFAGFGGVHLTLVELAEPAGPAPAPQALRRHCVHEVAFGVLDGLCHGYQRRPGHDMQARHALALRRVLRAEHHASHPSSTRPRERRRPDR